MSDTTTPSVLQQRIDTYRSMIAKAEKYDADGNKVMRDQVRRNAEEYADTRLGAAGRKIVGLDW